jgi:hypothetical protein
MLLPHTNTRVRSPRGHAAGRWPVVVVVPPPASNRKSFSAFGLMQACICICLPFGFAKPDDDRNESAFWSLPDSHRQRLVGKWTEAGGRTRGRPAGRGSGLRDRAGVLCFVCLCSLQCETRRDDTTSAGLTARVRMQAKKVARPMNLSLLFLVCACEGSYC